MKTTTEERRALVDKANKKLSIKKQCELFSIHRSGLYYQTKPLDPLNLELSRVIDQEYTLHPFRGVPSMTTFLRKDMGYPINKKRFVQNPDHSGHPFRFKHLPITYIACYALALFVKSLYFNRIFYLFQSRCY